MAFEGACKGALNGAFGLSAGGGIVTSDISIRSTSSSSGSNTSAIAVPKPAGLSVGDLMVCYNYMDGTRTPTAPAGWSSLIAPAQSQHSSLIHYKLAEASDVSASSFVFGSGVEGRAAIMLAIQNASGIITDFEFLASNTAGDITASTTPSAGGSLMIAFGSFDNNTIGWDKTPEGYDEVLSVSSSDVVLDGNQVYGTVWSKFNAQDTLQSITISTNSSTNIRYGILTIAPA